MKNIVLRQGTSYSLIARLYSDLTLKEYVVAYRYDVKKDSWASGAYFTDIENALSEYLEKAGAMWYELYTKNQDGNIGYYSYFNSENIDWNYIGALKDGEYNEKFGHLRTITREDYEKGRTL